MALAHIRGANELLEKAAANLQPELVDAEATRELLAESGGPASTTNLGWKCDTCHDDKTVQDRKDGKLKPLPGATRELRVSAAQRR